jgi:hypothetical protein
MMTEENKLTMLGKLLPDCCQDAHYKNVTDIPVIEYATGHMLLVNDEILLNILYLNEAFAGEKLSLIEEGKKHVSTQKDDDY